MSAEVADALVSVDVASAVKTCRTCGATKPLSGFRPQVKGGKVYYRSNCRECDNGKTRDNYQERTGAGMRPLDESATQVCAKCSRTLPLSEFPRRGDMRLGVLKKCKACHSVYSRKWTTTNSDKAYSAYLLRRFGISLAEYNVILQRQGGVCAICGELPDGPRNQRKGGRAVFRARLVVDHDHATGKVRGLLCNNCNCGIGYLKDDPATVAIALDYLKRGDLS